METDPPAPPSFSDVASRFPVGDPSLRLAELLDKLNEKGLPDDERDRLTGESIDIINTVCRRLDPSFDAEQIPSAWMRIDGLLCKYLGIQPHLTKDIRTPDLLPMVTLAAEIMEMEMAAQPDPDPAPPACNTENTQSTEDLLLDLWGLARHLKISLRWLRAECDAGRIPCLRAGKRRFFSLAAVREALVKRAADNAD